MTRVEGGEASQSDSGATNAPDPATRGWLWNAVRSREMVVALVAVLLASLSTAAISILTTNSQVSASQDQVERQIEASDAQVREQLTESRRQIQNQLVAARRRGIADARATAYADFVGSVERHLGALGASEARIRVADRNVFVSLGRIDLIGSEFAYTKAGAIASRARALTNASIAALQADERDVVEDRLFYRQQLALRDFTDAVRQELRR